MDLWTEKHLGNVFPLALPGKHLRVTPHEQGNRIEFAYGWKWLLYPALFLSIAVVLISYAISGSHLNALFVPAVFFLALSAMTVLAGAFGNEALDVRFDGFRHEQGIFGNTILSRYVSDHSIESIEIARWGFSRALKITTDQGDLRIGPNLTEEELLWLKSCMMVTLSR